MPIELVAPLGCSGEIVHHPARGDEVAADVSRQCHVADLPGRRRRDRGVEQPHPRVDVPSEDSDQALLSLAHQLDVRLTQLHSDLHGEG